MNLIMLGIVATSTIAVIGGLWGFFKYFNTSMQQQFDKQEKHSNKTDDLILSLIAQIAKIQGGNVGFVTTDQCRYTTSRNDERVAEQVKGVRTEVMGHINAVEVRLSNRITKIEDAQ